MALKRAGPLSKGTPQYLEARAPSRTEQRVLTEALRIGHTSGAHSGQPCGRRPMGELRAVSCPEASLVLPKRPSHSQAPPALPSAFTTPACIRRLLLDRG